MLTQTKPRRMVTRLVACLALAVTIWLLVFCGISLWVLLGPCALLGCLIGDVVYCMASDIVDQESSDESHPIAAQLPPADYRFSYKWALSRAEATAYANSPFAEDRLESTRLVIRRGLDFVGYADEQSPSPDKEGAALIRSALQRVEGWPDYSECVVPKGDISPQPTEDRRRAPAIARLSPQDRQALGVPLTRLEKAIIAAWRFT